MPDEPKISKHHAGQHPTLQSFRAFDIIPPSKVKPAHTARPVITATQPQHFDTTLTSEKPGPPKPKPAPHPELANGDQLAPKPETTSATQPEAASSEAQISTPAETPDETPEPQQPSEASDIENPVDAPETPKGFDATLETMPANPIPEPDSPEGIIEQAMTEAEGGMTPNQKINHSHEFNTMLQEFASHPAPNPDQAKPRVVVHRHDYLRLFNLTLLWLLAIALVAAIIFDILADTHVLKDTYGLPHTNFF